MAQNRDWMKAPRTSPEYLDGIISFLDFAQKKPGNDGWYCCPCVNCRNVNGKKTLSTMSNHLICDGIDQSYTTWFFHGESVPNVGVNNEVPSTSSSANPRMIDLIDDALKNVNPEFLDACMNDVGVEPDVQDEDDLPDDVFYRNLKEEAVQPIYPSCRDGQTKLSVTIELMTTTSGEAFGSFIAIDVEEDDFDITE
ncbi:hypothetical protein FRX31_002155 [Thalictrum thalictroides]|uniref:Transposase-associated domain-containing protein n=1 Tax=Thalictrum thalictroides TaxID=46969 RepID=A0A7J6XGM1_THATH|nr:hypothetical protein FRX31_002155 [Thalictrum thalictroides]